VKQVLDVDQITASKDGALNTQGVPLKISTYDKNAVEAAVQVKEKAGGETIAVATGPNIKEGVKEVLAMGCDKAFIINSSEFKDSDNLATSRVLAAAIQKIGGVELVTLGEGSLDSYSSLMAGRLAAALDWPLVSYASKLEVKDGKAMVTSRTGGVVERFEVPLPCIVSVSEEMNQPRLPPLLQILQAGKKPTTDWKLADLGLDASKVGAAGSGVAVVSNKAPTMERKNVRIKGTPQEAAAELAKALRKEGVF
jgi:electron transfer flavoprotein beta subunit